MSNRGQPGPCRRHAVDRSLERRRAGAVADQRCRQHRYGRQRRRIAISGHWTSVASPDYQWSKSGRKSLGQAQSLRRDRRLRPQPAADRRRGADRRRRSGFHEALSGGNLLPRVPQPGLRHLRMLAVELHGEDRGGRLPLRRRAGLRVADVPPHLDLCAHRPHQEAAGSEGQEGRRAGVPAHRQRLGARHPGGRFRREAEGHALDPRRHRARRPAGEDHHQAAEGRADGQRAGGQDHLGAARQGRDRRLHRAAAARGRSRRTSAGCSAIRSRRRRTITSAPGFSRSCT